MYENREVTSSRRFFAPRTATLRAALTSLATRRRNKKKGKQAKSDRHMLNASGSIGWISFVRNSRFCLGPHTWGRSPKMILAPFSHSESSFWETPKIINPISRISCWSSFLVIFDFHCYWLSSMLLVIIIGFYCWPTQLLVIIVSSLRNHFLLFFFTNFIRLVSSMPLLSIFRGMRRDENKRKIRGCS